MKHSVELLMGALAACAWLGACSRSDGPVNDAVNPNLNQNVATQTAGANSFTEEQARERIQQAGDTDLGDLQKTDDGFWRGQAKQNGRTVAVSLDYKGAVAIIGASPGQAVNATRGGLGQGGTPMSAGDYTYDASATAAGALDGSPSGAEAVRQAGERG